MVFGNDWAYFTRPFPVRERYYHWRLGPLHGMIGVGLAWVRLGSDGPGLHVKDTRVHRLMFSERNGYLRRLVIGPFSANVLPGVSA